MTSDDDDDDKWRRRRRRRGLLIDLIELKEEEPAYNRIDSASIDTPAYSISPQQQIILAITLLYWIYLAPTASFFRTIVH